MLFSTVSRRLQSLLTASVSIWRRSVASQENRGWREIRTSLFSLLTKRDWKKKGSPGTAYQILIPSYWPRTLILHIELSNLILLFRTSSITFTRCSSIGSNVSTETDLDIWLDVELKNEVAKIIKTHRTNGISKHKFVFKVRSDVVLQAHRL